MNLKLILLATVAQLSTSTGGTRVTGKGPCTDGGQCRKGVCVEINDDSYCSQDCGSCPGGMFCDDKLFGMLGLKVCVKGSSTEPPQPTEPPRVPCKHDKQCPGALVCAEMMGQRDCTTVCKADVQCKMPEMMGVTMDFMGCALDEGKRGRKACLPKRQCLANPMACIDVNPSTMGSIMMHGNMPQAMAPNMPSQSTPTPDITNSAPVAAVKIQPMSKSRFARLLKQTKRSNFEDERNVVLTTAATRNHFTCDQAGQVLGSISFGDEKISALRILAPKLVDKVNSHTILARFEFDDEKQEAGGILGE